MVTRQPVGEAHDLPPTPGVVTVVLRLIRRRLDAGELVGEGENVATGEVGEIRSAQDLVRLASGPAQPEELSS